MSTLDGFVNVLKAAAEPTRLRILALVAKGELSVKDITDILGQSQPRVSRHLRLLADAGLAARHAEGAWAYYSLPHGANMRELVLDLVGHINKKDPVAEGDRVRLEQLRAGHSADAAAYFATIAPSWDAIRGLHVPEDAIERAIVERVAARQVDSLLDFGTGTGRMLELLAHQYKSAIGLDSSREMIAVARAKLAAADIGHAQIRHADIKGVAEYEHSADLVVLHQVLHYFDDPGQVLVQAARALRDAGAVLVVDFAPHNLEFLRTEHAHRRLGMSEQQIAAWAKPAGLEISSKTCFSMPQAQKGLTVCLWLLEAGGEGTKTTGPKHQPTEKTRAKR